MDFFSEPDIHASVAAYISESAPVLLLVLTCDGTIVFANRHARNTISPDFVGCSIDDIVIDFSASFDLKTLAVTGEEQLLSLGNGSQLPQSFLCSFRETGSGRIALCGHADQTETAELQREMLELNRELNNLTRELHKANAQLKKLNSEKNRFLGMAAHDLRKPIGLVGSYCEFLIDETGKSLDEEHIGFLHTIQDSSRFMQRLVDDFLDVSAIEEGKFTIFRKPVSLDRLLTRSLAVNRLQAERKLVTLQVVNTADATVVEMDGDKMEQVITNIVSNAIEHSESGSEVIMRMQSDPASLTGSIQDFGCGISPEEMDRFFRPFEHGTTGKTAGEKSTGLGMTIARKIIEAHRGDIWIDSKVGRGTTVSFQIPIHQEQSI